jgi:hypothetical protein
MRTARKLEAEWRQVLWGRVSTGPEEDESSIGRVKAAGFHHVTARSCLARVLKVMNCLFFNFQFVFARGKPRITETADTESVVTGAQLYYKFISPENVCQLQLIALKTAQVKPIILCVVYGLHYSLLPCRSAIHLA